MMFLPSLMSSGSLCMRSNITYVAAMSIFELLRTYEVHTCTLDNGLTVVVRADRSADVVAILTYVKAGYFDEPDEWVGISHVLEHMYFKGTPTRGPGEIAQQTKAAGGYLNASTIYDHTRYYAVVPASSFEEALDIQADALLNPLLDADELARELEVIVQEAKRKLDNPAAVARESVYELLFDHHRMRRWRIGTEAGLRRLTRSDLHTFFERMYRGPEVVLVLAGAVDVDHAFAAVEKRYRALRSGYSTRDRGPGEPERRGFRWRELSGDVTQTRLELGWRTQPTMHADTPALELLAVILGQGRASRLYRAVRERGYATAISASNYTPTELGVFSISAEVRPPDTRAALAAIFQTLAAAAENITTDEVMRAQSIAEARMLRSLETMEGQANFLADWQALGDWRMGFDYLQRLLSLKPDDVQSVARNYLTPERAAIIAYRPANEPQIAADADEVRGWVMP